jgi:hypothetical protein
MNLRYGASLILLLHTGIGASCLLAQSPDQSPRTPSSQETGVWQTAKAEHVFGFPEIKHNQKGTLVLGKDALTFMSAHGEASIPRLSLTAVSAGNQRVELWGVGGRILRMAIPEGGGIAAATVMHHRVDMLTVEFRDNRGADRSAVFFLPAREADKALQSFGLPAAPDPAEHAVVSCHDQPATPGSVLVREPDWHQAVVPAAYRALVYEHLIERLRGSKEVGSVYRDGEAGACAQYTIEMAVTAFKEGSSVQRSFTGPVGMFVGATQIKVNVAFGDRNGSVHGTEQVAATMRGESESTNVADQLAKKIAKRYAKLLKTAGKTTSTAASGPSSL